MRDESPRLQGRDDEQAIALAGEWRRLGRVATAVAVLTSPALFLLLYATFDWQLMWALVGTLAGIVVFRGGVDVLAHKLIPAPALDATSRRRVWFWRHAFKVTFWLGLLVLIVLGAVAWANDESLIDAIDTVGDEIPSILTPALALFFALFVLLLILVGPLVVMGVRQIKTYEPDDANWGVELGDIRGQHEAKLQLARVVSLWQSSDERGVLLLGAPGTGKTMLSRAIATSLDCPFVTLPGSAFAQSVVGLDAVIARLVARKAKRMASKWGGRCIVFIDEIDAVGLRRNALGDGYQPIETGTIHDSHFYGPMGAMTSTGDLIDETAAWREKLFRMRAEPSRELYPRVYRKLADVAPGSTALNQLLAVIDGIDEPPLLKRSRTRTFNTFLDALYLVPARLRLKPPKPRTEEIYFIGATNVPLQALDPALTRPGRLGRHIAFRTPTWEDRRDIFDLYLGRVPRAERLDTERARDELARITNGYSPAMIDQACALALIHAHSDGRAEVSRQDLLEAMTTVETGVAIGQAGTQHELRAIAIHEAGHAVCSHVFRENMLATRLSIKQRGDTGGHHQAMAIEDRSGSWRSEEVGSLITVLGAMAAELVFYGQNGNGVGGDLHMATTRAAYMVGGAGMAPAPIELEDRVADAEERSRTADAVMERFEQLGAKLLHRSGGMDDSYFGPAVRDAGKRKLIAGLLGQSFVIAYATIQLNRGATERIADRLLDETELYGDDVTDMLDAARLRKPEIDVLDDTAWPVI